MTSKISAFFKLNDIRTLFFCVSVLIFGSNSFAQNDKIDSIKYAASNNNDTIRINILNAFATKYYNSQLDSSLSYALKARKLANKLEFKKGEYSALVSLHKIYNSRDDNRSMLEVNLRAVELAKEMRDKKLLAFAKARLGITYRYIHFSSRAFENLTEALALFDEIGDKKSLATYSVSIGNVYLNSGDHETAKIYYEQAIGLSKENPDAKASAEMTLGELYLREKKIELSFLYLDKAREYFKESNNDFLLAYTEMIKGEGLIYINELDSAMSNIEQAKSIYIKLNNPGKITETQIDLGEIYLKKGLPHEALRYFNDALEIGKNEPKKYSRLKMVHTGFMNAYVALGDYKKALESQGLILLFADSLNHATSQEKLSELKVRHEIVQAEMQIARLKLERQNQYILIALLTVLAIGAGIALYAIIKKYKHHFKAFEIGRRNLEVQLQEKENEESRLRMELELKIKELTSFTLNMVRKRESLETVKNELEDIKSKIDGDLKVRLAKILSTIKFSDQASNDWEVFKLYFDQVNQGFFDNLRSQYPQLNANDFKLCALLRMNLDTKQVASIMDISPVSVKIARYRLKKKLGIPKNKSLTTFLATFSDPQQSLAYELESDSIIESLLKRQADVN